MRRDLLQLVVFILAISLIGVTPAQAHSLVGATGSTSCDDLNKHEHGDPTIQYRRSGLSLDMYDAVGFVMTNRVHPTDLNADSVSDGGDFVYFDALYTTFCGKNWWTPSEGGLVGMAKCDALDGAQCERHHVHFHLGWTQQASTTNQRKLSCHETGHSIGIPHNNHTAASQDSCTENPASSADTSDYSSHEIQDMINFAW